MKLRVGIVGLGEAWESRHRHSLRSLSDRFEVRAVCAEVGHLARQAAREFNAVAVDGFRSLTRRGDVDALLVLSTEWFGALPLLAACEAGKAVYCGAALDLAPGQALELRRRVEESGIAFMVEFPRRHSSATVRLKELIATQLGRPRLMFCHVRRPVLRAGSARYRPGRCPEQMRDLIELVDWCRYVAGCEPTTVVGVGHKGLQENDDDYQMMSLDFSPDGAFGTGTMAQISCGRYMPANWPEAISFRPPSGLQVCCEKGVAFVDLPSTVVWFDEAGRHVEQLDSERPVGDVLLMQFHRSVTSLVRKTADLEDAYRAIHVVLTSRTSFEEGRRVPIVFTP